MIDQPIGRKRSDPTTFQVNVNGKKAQTNYKVLKKSEYFSFINFYPKTGRTHQIRVHSSFIGNPIIGDEKYGGGNSRIKGYLPEVSKKMEVILKSVDRHILHAQKIIFIHPRNEKEVSFEAKLPEDIQNVINSIDELHV